MAKIILSIVLFLFILTACEDILEFPQTNKYKTATVIEAIITNNVENQFVRVSYTTSLQDSASSVQVANAIIKLANSNGDTASFIYLENGWYKSSGLTIEPGTLYTISVQAEEVVYQSSSEMAKGNELDSVGYVLNKNSNVNEPLYNLKIFAGEIDQSQIKYYQIHMFKNHNLITSGSDFYIFSDLATQSLNGLELGTDFSKNDTIDVALYTLTKQMYDYYLEIYSHILFNGNYNVDYKTNPPIQFEPDALGYFQVSSVSYKRVIIK